MTVSDRDWEALNAYADGELDAAAAAALRRRLSRERPLAEALEEIAGLKSSLGALRPTEQEEPPRRAFTKPLLALAASLLLLVAIGLAVFWLRAGADQAASIRGLHATLSAEPFDFAGADGAALAAGSGLALLQAPDLTPTNLKLASVRMLDEEGRVRIALHYRGARGCRVTLIADRGPAAEAEDLSTFDLLHRWSTPATRYTLVADGMDRRRFAAIGAFAEALSRTSEEAPVLRVALEERTAQAVPCA